MALDCAEDGCEDACRFASKFVAIRELYPVPRWIPQQRHYDSEALERKICVNRFTVGNHPYFGWKQDGASGYSRVAEKSTWRLHAAETAQLTFLSGLKWVRGDPELDGFTYFHISR